MIPFWKSKQGVHRKVQRQTNKKNKDPTILKIEKKKQIHINYEKNRKSTTTYLSHPPIYNNIWICMLHIPFDMSGWLVSKVMDGIIFLVSVGF